MTLYMAVTADKLELPLIVTPYLDELAERFNRPKGSIQSEMCRRSYKDWGARRGYKFMRIEVDDDEQM